MQSSLSALTPPLIKLKSVMNSLTELDLNLSVFPSDPLSWTLPELLRSSEDGLAHVPIEILAKCIRPVLDGLQSIDAESLLELERIHKGAALSDGISVRPIHPQIKPPCAEGTVRYIHLSDMQGQYSMGIFVFPPHSKIPLHDHPGMCVLSRVLYGSLQRLSLDLARDQSQIYETNHIETKEEESDSVCPWNMSWNATAPAAPQPQRQMFPPGTLRAYKNRVDHLQAPDCTALYPFEGNLHEFIAGPDGAAVLDVLFPPYDEQHRDCTFYNIVENHDEMADSSHQESCWIVPTGQPEDFHCISGHYQSLGADC